MLHRRLQWPCTRWNGADGMDCAPWAYLGHVLDQGARLFQLSTSRTYPENVLCIVFCSCTNAKNGITPLSRSRL
jgi:hypothetical protein